MDQLKKATSQLLKLADEYEEAAERIRSAVTVLADLPPLPDKKPAAQVRRLGTAEETDTALPITPTMTGRIGDVSEAQYLEVFEQRPDRRRNAQGVFDQLARQGTTPASVDAVRTALIRLAGKKKIKRVGRGLYQLA